MMQISQQALRKLIDGLKESRTIVLGRPCISVSRKVLSRALSTFVSGNVFGDSDIQKLVKNICSGLGAIGVVTADFTSSTKLYFVFDRKHMIDLAMYFARLGRRVYVYDVSREIVVDASNLTYIIKTELIFNVRDRQALSKIQDAISGLLDDVEVRFTSPLLKIAFIPEHVEDAHRVINTVRSLAHARPVKAMFYVRYIPGLLEPLKLPRARPVRAVLEACVRYRRMLSRIPHEKLVSFIANCYRNVKFEIDGKRIRITYRDAVLDEYFIKLINYLSHEHKVLYIEHVYALDLE